MLGVKWKITSRIKSLLAELEALNIVFTKYHPRPELIDSLRRQSFLNSSIYSARIENIPARVDDPLIHKKQEIANLISAYTYLNSSRAPKSLSVKLIKHLHSLVLKNISPDAGSLRQEPWAIFNSAGVAIYLAPAHFKLPGLINDYVKLIFSLKEPKPVIAAIAQFVFEKIHPFADGNGRVGRLISTYILTQSGFTRVAEFEKYLDDHRSQYYQVLEPNTNCTQFIEFFLDGLVENSRSKLEQIKQVDTPSPELKLTFRRREILAIIRDHPGCSFDFIRRRFIQVSRRTLHYDLEQLQKRGFITKLGITRGAVYTPVE